MFPADKILGLKMLLKKYIRKGIVSSVLFLALVPAIAADNLPVIQMQHTSWTSRDGAPTGVTAIAQTKDGWLWIGSAMGLFRFDGVRFQRMVGANSPLSSSIAALGLLPDGILWITYKFGGASLMTAKGMAHFRPGEHGMPAGTAQCLGQDADGQLWLGGARGLSVLGKSGDWHTPAASLQAPEGQVMSMLLDRRGVFWVRNSHAVSALGKNGTRFEVRHVVAGFGTLAEDPDGAVWTSDMSRPGLELVAGSPRADSPALGLRDKITYFQFDHAGNLWQPDYSGVKYVGSVGSARQQQTGAAQGLSGQHGYTMFEDREQNVWIGTENGLDRFRDFRFRPLALPQYLGAARPLAAQRSGGVVADGSALATPGAVPVPFGPGLPSSQIVTALHAAPDDTVWTGAIGGLWKTIANHSEAVALPPSFTDPGRAIILAMTSDETGALWVSFGRRGLYTLRDGAWAENGGVAGLAQLFPTVVASDARGRTWFGSTDDRLMLLENGKLRQLGRSDGLHLGTLLTILPTAGGGWVGGENGVAFVAGNKVIPLTGRGDDPFAGTTGIAFAADGSLWLNGGAGLTSVGPDEIKLALRQPGHHVRFARFDYRDGLQGSASPITPFPSLVRSNDNVLWFSTSGGTFAVDPTKLSRNALPPPVYITALRGNGEEYTMRGSVKLPAHSDDLSIDFTALSLRASEHVNFRYQLEGFDHGWHETQGRRSAHYTNLAPGQYRFRVLASNDDNVWNDAGAALSFEIVPSITQTVWFKAACLLAAAAGMWLIHRWRLARLSSLLQLRMNERISERTRIARALHDTILQSMQGIILHLDVAVAELPMENPVRGRLDRILTEADRAYVEGRDQVTALRTNQTSDIEGIITETSETLLPNSPGTTFQWQVTGERVELQHVVSEEIVEITREAIRNAFRHAEATNIDVTLDFGVAELTMTVRDNGKGITSDMAPGHWGLVGMRERATRIKAELVIVRDSHPGTFIALKVPAQCAYVARPQWRWLRFKTMTKSWERLP